MTAGPHDSSEDMFGILRNLKRRKLRAQPVPSSWNEVLKKHLRFFEKLDDAEREVFFEKLQIFLSEKSFIGAKDFNVTEEVKLVIAAQAVRLILYLDISYYNRLNEIVVYPYDYKRAVGDNTEYDGREAAYCGEVDDWSIVVLSWPSVLEGLTDANDGFNPGLHEFAHVLDRATGTFNGTPVLRKRAHYQEWAKVMSRHFLKLQKGASHQNAVLDDYGAENEAEFFAVSTEAFFERPHEMREMLSDLYIELKRFYGYDPIKFL